jgi:hypothetical protein
VPGDAILDLRATGRQLMTGSLRLIADDLTGALDTAAEFTGLCGAIDVAWTESLP